MFEYQITHTGKGAGNAFKTVQQDNVTYTEINVDAIGAPFEIHVERDSGGKPNSDHYSYDPGFFKEPTKEYTLEEIEKFYNDATAEWRKSETLKTYQDFFNIEQPGLKDKIDSIIVLALGTLSAFEESNFHILGGPEYPVVKQSLYQLAWFQSLHACLPKVTPDKIYFQDPQFTQLDKEFLNKQGYNIGEWPFTYNRMTKTTLLISLGAISAAMHAVEIECPAMYIGFPLFTRKNWKEKSKNHKTKVDDPNKWFTENLFDFGDKKLEKIMPGDSIKVENYFFVKRREADAPTIQMLPRLYENLYYLKPEDIETIVPGVPIVSTAPAK